MNVLEEEVLQEVSEDTQHGRYLTFDVGTEEFGIGIRYVTEIVGMHPITALPEMPDYIRGIINLRGKIFPVMDVRLRFHKPPIQYTDRTCIIVVNIEDLTVGLIVDQVAEVMSISDENISLPPDYRTGFVNRYISGIGKVGNEVKLLIDTENLFMEEEIQQMLVNESRAS